MKHLFEILQNYSKEDIYPFHMPGHKRNFSQVPFLNMDITEIDGFDNLNNPTGILKELNQRLAGLFGAKESFLSVNGATSCVHAALFALCGSGGKIAVSANCHKSVYSALLISGAEPVFMEPEYMAPLSVFGSVKPETVRKTIAENPDLKGVFIVSPTYEGITSDIRTIAEICHEKAIPLVVDEAHGAHFFLSDIFPETALSQGADIVIHGLHKTLPFPTQTGLLSIQGDLINRDIIASLMTMTQSSSPSYILMGAAEKGLSFMEEESGEQWKKYIENLISFRKGCKDFINIKLLEKEDYPDEIFDYDMGKLIICGKKTSLSGKKTGEILTKNKIQAEAVCFNHAILMTSLLDTAEGFERLFRALKEADVSDISDAELKISPIKRNEKISMREAFFSKSEFILPEKCQGRISADFVSIYPPGIPVLIPGTVIEIEHIEILKEALRRNLEITGFDFSKGIKVITE
ncbi:MAG: aminotransferase class I/II-fold pyridoxal phosphate-dependent enzyme [Firmicutes bacterium]|nr:aminotransferase class I/II-fold pyridoxal phosphate-dependent enzyme [Bacillota bacterium]